MSHLKHRRKNASLNLTLTDLISDRTRKALARENIFSLKDLHLEHQKRQSYSPAQTIQSAWGIGNEALAELLNFVLFEFFTQDRFQHTAEISPHVTQIFCALIGGASGDLGGRDQAMQLSEIALDFAEALETKTRQRLYDSNQPSGDSV